MNAIGVTSSSKGNPSLTKRIKNVYIRSSMHLMQGNLRTALLGTEPESAEQSQKYIQQQKSHTHNVITQIIAPRLLVVTPYIFKRTYFGDKDVTDTELLLTVFLQAPDEIMILIGPDTKAQPSPGSYQPSIKKGVRITGLLEITVTYIFQSCPPTGKFA